MGIDASNGVCGRFLCRHRHVCSLFFASHEAVLAAAFRFGFAAFYFYFCLFIKTGTFN